MTLPVPAMPPIVPGPLLTRAGDVRSVRIDLSEAGALETTAIDRRGEELSCVDVGLDDLDRLTPLPFRASLGLDSDDVRLGLAHAGSLVLGGAASHDGVRWRLDLARKVTADWAPGLGQPAIGSTLGMPLRLEWAGLSVRTRPLETTWSSAEGAAPAWRRTPIDLAYALPGPGGALADLDAGLTLDPALDLDRSALRSAVQVAKEFVVGPCAVRQEAELKLLGHPGRARRAFDARIEIEHELKVGDHLDLMLAYESGDMVRATASGEGPLAAGTISLRLVLAPLGPGEGDRPGR